MHQGRPTEPPRLAQGDDTPDRDVGGQDRGVAQRVAGAPGGLAQRLADAASCQAYLLDGGLEAWKKAGLPVAVDARQPLEIMRQVQIAAGSLVVLGVVLGTWVAPAFYGISAFVGAGLMFAGVSGWCGMARMLALMPWNKRGPAVA